MECSQCRVWSVKWEVCSVKSGVYKCGVWSAIVWSVKRGEESVESKVWSGGVETVDCPLWSVPVCSVEWTV